MALLHQIQIYQWVIIIFGSDIYIKDYDIKWSKLIQFCHSYYDHLWAVNPLRPRQNGRHFTDDTFKPIFFNENARISIKISLKLLGLNELNKETVFSVSIF